MLFQGRMNQENLVFHVVQFSVTEEFEIVSSSWILTENNRIKCKFPTIETDQTINCAKKHYPPSAGWGIFDVKILYSTSEITKFH